MKAIAVSLLLAALAMGSATAQEGASVSSLLKDGYEIKGVIPSTAGPGILLEKGSDVVMCFVAETSESDAIVTQYCKPVQ
jgi:hypothetical protein